MIIIRMKGGIGNQMFQYALYTELKYLGRDVRMDDVNGFADDAQRDPVLKETFQVDYETATGDEIRDLRDSHMGFWDRVRRRLTGRHSLEIVEPDGVFRPEILEKEDAYLDGYWQSEKYFPDTAVVSSLRKAYAIRPEDILTDDAGFELLSRIRQAESVSVHVRRGDYLWPGVVENFGGICTEEYYQKAMEYILQEHPDATFFVFTNDKEWCKEHMTGERVVTVDLKPGGGDVDILDMMLMSECRHHIIANSSYSWWAAWLNDAPEKRVIAPQKWLNNKNMQDIYTEKMIRL